MSRKELRVSIKMRTNGSIYACPSVNGDIIIYEDQLLPINSKIARCKTREEAREILFDVGCGLDVHHADIHPPTIRKKNTRQRQSKNTQIEEME